MNCCSIILCIFAALSRYLTIPADQYSMQVHSWCLELVLFRWVVIVSQRGGLGLIDWKSIRSPKDFDSVALKVSIV